MAVTGIRALVQRPRRKMHLAQLDVEVGAWATFCDLFVAADERTEVWRWDAVGGVSQRVVNELRRLVAQRPAGSMCAHCRRMQLVLELTQHDRLRGVLAEYGRAA